MDEREKMRELLKRMQERKESLPVRALNKTEEVIRDVTGMDTTPITGEETMPVGSRGMGGRPRRSMMEDEMQPMEHDPEYEAKQLRMMQRLEDERMRKMEALKRMSGDEDDMDGYRSMGSQESRRDRLKKSGWNVD